MPEQRRTNQTIHITGTSTAAPHRVFEVLIDTARWPDWAPMSAAEIQQPAPGDEPEGLGAIRRFTTGRTVSVERVVAFDRNRAFSYELISGLPLLDYRADVTLDPPREEEPPSHGTRSSVRSGRAPVGSTASP